jgi:hypothetical protein
MCGGTGKAWLGRITFAEGAHAGNRSQLEGTELLRDTIEEQVLHNLEACLCAGLLCAMRQELALCLVQEVQLIQVLVSGSVLAF